MYACYDNFLVHESTKCDCGKEQSGDLDHHMTVDKGKQST